MDTRVQLLVLEGLGLAAIIVAAALLFTWIQIHWSARRLQESLTTLRTLTERIRARPSTSLDDMEIVKLEVANALADLRPEYLFARPPFIDLRSVVETMASQHETSSETLASALEAMSRHVDAQRRMLLAQSPLLFQRNQQPKDQPLEAAAPKSKTRLITPDEAAILASITEKFYGSASFKALGLALVGAVLLAGSGIVYLGSQTVNGSSLKGVGKSEFGGGSAIAPGGSRLT
jgi:predicted ATPase